MILEMMAAMEGFTYTELRDMPLGEFMYVRYQVGRIQTRRRAAAKG